MKKYNLTVDNMDETQLQRVCKILSTLEIQEYIQIEDSLI